MLSKAIPNPPTVGNVIEVKLLHEEKVLDIIVNAGVFIGNTTDTIDEQLVKQLPKLLTFIFDGNTMLFNAKQDWKTPKQ